jgi:ABC-2 type transport system permease protein
MNNTLTVARREFVERVRSRGFLITTLGTPLFLIVVWYATGMLNVGPSAGNKALEPPVVVVEAPLRDGVVDLAGLFDDMALPKQLVLVPDEEQAAEMLRQGGIDAYIVVPGDYRETGTLRRVTVGLPDTEPQTALAESALVTAMLQDWPADVALRLAMPLTPDGLEAVQLSAEQGQRADPGMMPLVLASLIMVPLFTGGGWLLRSLAEEKESRVMEVLLVSLRPVQLLTGKLLGLGGLILLQYLAWGVVFVVASRLLSIPMANVLSGLSLSGPLLVAVILLAVGGFVLYSALMAGLGAVTPDVHSSQSWVFIITLPMMVPFYLWMVLTENPMGALAVGLSLFPYSAPLAMLLRMMVSTVPAWQLALSLGLIVLTSVATIRLMSRLFKAQVLLSGEPLSWRRIMAALRR